MANLLAVGQAWLTEKLKTYAGESVLYKRGDDNVAITAVLGRSQGEVVDGDGSAQLKWTDADFLLAAADLVLIGERTTPRAGDQVLRTMAGKVYTFEVGALPGLDVWNWADEHRTRMRVRTKQVKVEDA